MSKYIKKINRVLKSRVNKNSPIVIDLFAGCGGLALGFEAQGFKTIGYEMDKDCCDTYKNNLDGNCIKSFLTIKSKLPKAHVVIGGPPCQPFSVRGKQQGLKDKRNGFPAFVNAIKTIKPDVWLFENVRGLMYQNKKYLEEILKNLKKLDYNYEYELIKAVDYFVPQNRERVIAVGYKKDKNFNFPQKKDTRVTAGEALGDMAYSELKNPRYLTSSMDNYIARYEAASKCITPRDLHLHLPARTLTCRNLSGATSDMHRIKLPNGKRRRLTTREAARLQSFPDWFKFKGSENSIFNQIGNAVPPMLSYYIAGAIKEQFNFKI